MQFSVATSAQFSVAIDTARRGCRAATRQTTLHRPLLHTVHLVPIQIQEPSHSRHARPAQPVDNQGLERRRETGTRTSSANDGVSTPDAPARPRTNLSWEPAGFQNPVQPLLDLERVSRASSQIACRHPEKPPDRCFYSSCPYTCFYRPRAQRTDFHQGLLHWLGEKKAAGRYRERHRMARRPCRREEKRTEVSDVSNSSPAPPKKVDPRTGTSTTSRRLHLKALPLVVSSSGPRRGLSDPRCLVNHVPSATALSRQRRAAHIIETHFDGALNAIEREATNACQRSHQLGPSGTHQEGGSRIASP